jgi:hypothetical protein
MFFPADFASLAIGFNCPWEIAERNVRQFGSRGKKMLIQVVQFRR